MAGKMSSERRLQCLSRHFLHSEKANATVFHGHCSSGVMQRNTLSSDLSPVVIGGMVLDIHAKPSSALRAGTTTPGKVSFVKGGVARNVAECIAKLGTKPFIISIVGTDPARDVLLEHWKSLGLSIEGILRSEGIATPVVSNVFDPDGEITAAVAAVDAVEVSLIPEWISRFKHHISNAPVLMLDANLSPLTLKFACQLASEYNTPVWFEPVSLTKSKKIEYIIDYVHFVSPNEDELVSMANSLSSVETLHSEARDKVRDNHSTESLLQFLRPAISALLERGIKVILLTLGPKGVFLCSKDHLGYGINRTSLANGSGLTFKESLFEIMISVSTLELGDALTMRSKNSIHVFHFPAVPVSAVRLTGAGDCLVGGIIASLCAGLDVLKSTAVGMAAAKAAILTELNVPCKFSLSTLTDDAKTSFLASKSINMS